MTLTRTARLLLAAALALGAGTTVLPGAAAAAGVDPPATVVTDSATTVAWLSQGGRSSADGSGSYANNQLKDWRLRVSQTQSLLNQTIEVSWAGADYSNGGNFLELMQCWSDGPTVAPTREQCAYGGYDREGAEGFGAGKTRILVNDPRERDYRIAGDLSAVSVDGNQAPGFWSENAQVVMGSGTPTCPAGTTGYRVDLVPPKDAGSVSPLHLQAPTDGTPPSLTRTDAAGFTRHYSVVTQPFSFAALKSAAHVTSWVDGDYRVEVSCLNAAEASPPVRLVGWVQRLTTAKGAVHWQRSGHESDVFVPFDPLGDAADLGPTDPFERDQVLDYIQPRVTNEVFQGRTRPDGTGDVFMELQTDLEAQHLGCGRREATAVRSCWLVAVPRWAGEPDGSQPIGNQLASPLSQTLWDRRIEVPLGFAPVSAGCKIGSGLKQLLAHDLALGALRSWQPQFCGDSTTASSVLGPLQDDAIRNTISSPNRLGVVAVPPEGVDTLVTAPVTTSGVVVGFSADRQFRLGADRYVENGTRTTVLNLNARLLAKLLTQSYDHGAAPNGGKDSGYNSSTLSGTFQPVFTPRRSFPKNNPRRLYDDPEFLKLNPDAAGWLAQGSTNQNPEDMADVLVSANSADAYNVLWRWILGDRTAKAFLEGAPDPDGMLVNPYYKGKITADLAGFPQYDPTCVDNISDPAANTFPLLCQINLHPRVDDDSKAAQAAVRGDTKRFNIPPLVYDGTATGYKAEARQTPGKAGMLVITNSAVAARYGLPTARLQNSSGAFVAATSDSLATARDQMTARSDGVLVADPAHVHGAGYPLTTMSYALVDVAATTQAQNNAFAKILDYAAGAGQVPGTALGQLPPGYAPLPAAMTARLTKGAATLRDPSALLLTDNGQVPPGTTPPPTTPSTGEGTAVPPTGVISSGRPAVGPLGPPLLVNGPAPVTASGTDVAATSSTGNVAVTLPWLVPGLLCAAAGALLLSRLLRNLGGATASG